MSKSYEEMDQDERMEFWGDASVWAFSMDSQLPRIVRKIAYRVYRQGVMDGYMEAIGRETHFVDDEEEE